MTAGRMVGVGRPAVSVTFDRWYVPLERRGCELSEL
jgi:hypothetical protein